MLSFMCRRLDVGASGGYSTLDKFFAGVDVRSRLTAVLQLGLQGRIYQTNDAFAGSAWVGLTF
jgi:hypothetical protein